MLSYAAVRSDFTGVEHTGLRQQRHSRLGASFAAAWRTVLEWERRRRSRQALRSLGRFEIQDFCPDLMEAEREANRPFWRA
jgi:uncharacterized protein YjiS (DUF1127 family)